MDSIIKTFHIDIWLLFAQVFNFFIVFLILYFFVIKPLQKILEDRENTIKQSLEDAKKAKEKLEQIEIEYKNTIEQANLKAKEIINKAIQDAELQKVNIINQAKEESTKILDQQKKLLENEKLIVMNEIKLNINDIVFDIVKKIFQDLYTQYPNIDKEIINKIISDIKIKEKKDE